MNLNAFLLDKAFTTYFSHTIMVSLLFEFALKWLVFCVNAHMALLVLRLGKAFITYFALIWFFSSMNKQVSFKVSPTSKSSYHILYTGMVSLQYEFAGDAADHLTG